MNYTEDCTKTQPDVIHALALLIERDSDLKARTRKRGQWLYPARLKSDRPAPAQVECPDCEGAGVIPVMIRDTYLGMRERFEPCETCGESGYVNPDDLAE